MKTYEFICNNIDRTTKRYDKNFSDGIDIPLIELPYPFTTPCAEGMFQEMYYWDTYFTHKCLLLTKRGGQVRNNLKNFTFLLNKFGKILNGNRMHYVNRSQPPFFGLMLSDAMCADENIMTLEESFAALEKEYRFWMTERLAKNGLNVYSGELAKGESLVGYYADRTGVVLSDTEENNRGVIAECESGWDFSPRFHSQITRYNPVDLNCLLYADEMLLSAWAKALGEEEKSQKYACAAKERKEKLTNLMKKDGVYFDYNFVTEQTSEVVSCAAFFPYFVGLDDDKDGYLKALSALERAHGVVACDYENGNFQWSAPNSWAPLNYVAVAAAVKLGLTDVAKRLADEKQA